MNLPFDPEAGLVAVPARVHGPAGVTVVRLALDTGASWSMIAWDPLVLLGYDPAVETARIQITTGSSVKFAPPVIVSRLEALGQQRDRFSVLCHTLPPSAMVDGVLGLNFFRGQRLVVDFRAGLVSLD